LRRRGPDRRSQGAYLISSPMARLAIWGNAYIAKYRRAGEVAELGPLHPERVRPELEGGRLRFRYSDGGVPEQTCSRPRPAPAGSRRPGGAAPGSGP
jgi:hypothetical protein